MHYQDKYFDQDKNTILRAAQGFVETQLIQHWILCAIESYNSLENPLGLEDDFILRLKAIDTFNERFLEEPYELFSAVYRFKKGNNQLEFIWDGRSHYEVYAEQWKEAFEDYCRELCARKEIYRAILKACVLQDEGVNHKFLFYSIRRIILSHFQVDINRKKILVSA
jgi:hypothetical protein